MPRIDAVLTRQLYEDEAILYRLTTPTLMPPGALPAPRLDRLRLPDVLPLSQFLAVFFPPMLAPRRGYRGEASYPIRIFEDRASVVVDANAAVPLTCTLPRLMDVVVDINDWMCTWASAADRFPSLNPAWAAYLGFSEADVDAIATGIVNRVAAPEEFRIVIRNYQGCEAVVEIPARAKLRLRPTPGRKAASRLVDIRALEDVPVAKTAGGKKVLMLGSASAPRLGDGIAVDPKVIHRAVVLIPERIAVRKQAADPPRGRAAEPSEEEG